MYSIARPSRLVRASATTMRYCGLRIFPIRRSRIRTATVCSLLDSWLLLRSSPTTRGGDRANGSPVTGDVPGLEGAGHAPKTSRPLCQTRPERKEGTPANALRGIGVPSFRARAVPAGRQLGYGLPGRPRPEVAPASVEGEHTALDQGHQLLTLGTYRVRVGHPVVVREPPPLGQLVLVLPHPGPVGLDPDVEILADAVPPGGLAVAPPDRRPFEVDVPPHEAALVGPEPPDGVRGAGRPQLEHPRPLPVARREPPA